MLIKVIPSRLVDVFLYSSMLFIDSATYSTHYFRAPDEKGCHMPEGTCEGDGQRSRKAEKREPPDRR